MKYFLVISLSLLFSSFFSSAQVNYQQGESLEFYRSYIARSDDWLKTLEESDIEGSPYLNDDFITGTVYTTSKVQYNNIPLRYNIFNDNIEFRTPEDQVLAIAAPEIIESVVFGDYEMKYIPYVFSKKMRRGFFKELANGKVSLYARPNILFQKPTKPGPYKEAKPAKFISKPDSYYLRMGTEAAEKINSKKELLELFPDHQKEIAAFIKKNKIKPTKEDQLIELVTFYNSL